MEFQVRKQVLIPVDDIALPGELILPKDAHGIVIFSHGSGSSRLSPRNRKVAEYLHRLKFGTLLFDLLTQEEDSVYENRFNIGFLTDRLVAVTQWLEKQPDVQHCPLAYFGASTGAASALSAAARLPQIKAVVSRGGRPDLAMEALAVVKAPTLLIVGSWDEEVILLNQKALEQMRGIAQLVLVPGATHLFEEPGKMQEVEKLAGAWLQKYL